MIHWPFGGSTAARTLNCPGWRQRADTVPPLPEGPYAAEGSALHHIMEQALLDDQPYAKVLSYKGRTVNGVEITDEHIDRCADALDAFQQLKDDYGMFEYEPEVGAEYNEDTGGHADFVGVTEDNCTVFIGDFKFGRGIQIEPQDNAQALFYAMVLRYGSSAADMFMQAENVVVVIIQPNDRDLPTLRVWKTDIFEVNQFERRWKAAHQLAISDDPPLNPGKHCKFCPAEAVCEARLGGAHAALLMDPEDQDRLREALNMLPDLRAWITAVEQTALRQLENGAEISGYKLVAKRAIRRWAVDEAEVYKKLSRKLGGKKAMSKASLLSPAQIEKLAKKKDVDISKQFETLVVSQSSGKAIAREDDKRPPALATDALAAALKGHGTG